MKILVIHNFHRKGSASGDDQVYKSETALLESHGNEVVRYTVSNDEFDNEGVIGKVMSTFGMLWSFKHYRAVQSFVKEEQPDVVHIHTFFPLLSPSILYAAKKAGALVVATLHDTRFVCPCSTSLRCTHLCNDCGDGHYLRMCKYGCFKGSRLQSLFVAGIFKYHRIRKSFYKQIDKYICLNENQIRLLTDIAFDKAKIVKKYNFVPDAEARIGAERDKTLPDRYAVFYGRIGEEKGIRILMQIWNQINDIPLVVMGGGPLEEEFRVWADKKDNVHFLGYTQHDKCLAIVKGGEFVIFPSIWYEGCSMVEIETMSLGRGLIATDLGFSMEAIEDGVNGYKVPLGDIDGFIERVRYLWSYPEECQRLGTNARNDYKDKYMPENNYLQLMEIYKAVLGNGGNSKASGQRMNVDISKADKLNILFRTCAKIMRGGIYRIFLKEAHGLFLVGKKVQISHGKHIKCGKNVKFEDYTEIHGLCSEGLVFGDYVTISRGVMIRPSSYYGGDLGCGLVMGEHSSIGPYGYVGCSGKITIGKNVMFGPKCSLFAENHNFNDTEACIKSQGVNQKGITVEDDCWIGSNVTILDGVTIGKGSVIGAGTLVTKDIPAGSVVIDKREKIIKARV